MGRMEGYTHSSQEARHGSGHQSRANCSISVQAAVVLLCRRHWRLRGKTRSRLCSAVSCKWHTDVDGRQELKQGVSQARGHVATSPGPLPNAAVVILGRVTSPGPSQSRKHRKHVVAPGAAVCMIVKDSSSWLCLAPLGPWFSARDRLPGQTNSVRRVGRLSPACGLPLKAVAGCRRRGSRSFIRQ